MLSELKPLPALVLFPLLPNPSKYNTPCYCLPSPCESHQWTTNCHLHTMGSQRPKLCTKINVTSLKLCLSGVWMQWQEKYFETGHGAAANPQLRGNTIYPSIHTRGDSSFFTYRENLLPAWFHGRSNAHLPFPLTHLAFCLRIYCPITCSYHWRSHLPSPSHRHPLQPLPIL